MPDQHKTQNITSFVVVVLNHTFWNYLFSSNRESTHFCFTFEVHSLQPKTWEVLLSDWLVIGCMLTSRGQAEHSEVEQGHFSDNYVGDRAENHTNSKILRIWIVKMQHH